MYMCFNRILNIFINSLCIVFVIFILDGIISLLLYLCCRSIYVSHSVMGKLIFYIFLLVGWHIWLLIVVPLITHMWVWFIIIIIIIIIGAEPLSCHMHSCQFNDMYVFAIQPFCKLPK